MDRRSRFGKKNSKFRGVQVDKRNPQNWRWKACIWIDGKTKNCGSFNTEKEAALAYNKASKELFGDYGWLNDV